MMPTSGVTLYFFPHFLLDLALTPRAPRQGAHLAKSGPLAVQCCLQFTYLLCCRVALYTQPSKSGFTLEPLSRSLKKTCLQSSVLCTAPQCTPCSTEVSYRGLPCPLCWLLAEPCGYASSCMLEQAYVFCKQQEKTPFLIYAVGQD